MKKNLKHLIVASILTSTFIPGLNAQEYMRINRNDGSVIEIAITDIQKITFDNITDIPSTTTLALDMMKMKLFPNPAKEYLNIEYTLTEDGPVTLEVYSITGQLVHSASLGMQKSGEYQYQWSSSKVAPGTYISAIRQNQGVITRKVIIKN